jgi:hypothetical protein
MLRLPECRATNRHCDRNRLIVPVVGSSPTLVQLHARAMFSLISDTPASWKLASLLLPSAAIALMKTLPLPGRARMKSSAFGAKAARDPPGIFCTGRVDQGDLS